MIAEFPGDTYADDAAQKGTAHKPSFAYGVESKIAFHQTNGSGNYRGIKTEKKPTQGGNQANEV
ncbi:hypothetical protein GCM10011413_18380 [Pedobacter psychrotolerans]|uniref:Uncharacterized protein n=1 Tax=Pedobacter psychrotolerans TaxID=1843235 RepID=A0ABQ1SR78_9SPHI|nr:hypothetical protein GCM10011413_18380 [Pedobacter psychrotolerans]